MSDSKETPKKEESGNNPAPGSKQLIIHCANAEQRKFIMDYMSFRVDSGLSESYGHALEDIIRNERSKPFSSFKTRP